jgi:nucleoside-diphosphate-sugar epimerase
MSSSSLTLNESCSHSFLLIQLPTIIKQLMKSTSRGVEVQQFGDGSSSRNHTYIDNITDSTVCAIDRPHANEVFNLGEGSGTSLRDFIRLVQKYVSRKAIIKVLPDQPGDVLM